ncbi:MAG TPA: hypothetical protein VHF25_07730, partial [Nitriliruptorales bacterium]|nr:hypothetical protein [Nitriliruptorales bacterium]
RTARQRTAEDGTTGDQALAPLGGIILGAFGSGFVRATGGLPPVVVPVRVACLAAMALTAGPRGRDVVRTVTVGGLWAAALVAPQAVLAHHAASGRLVAAVVGFPILLLLLVLAAFTVDGSTGSDRASTPARRPHRGSAVVAAVVAALAIAWLAMGPTIAEVLRSHRPTASDPGRRVARLAAVARWLPPQDHLQSDLARGRLVAATVAQDPDARLDQLRRARSALMRARSLSPYDAQHSLDLAALHRHAADLLVPGDRIHYLRRAVAHGTDAARLGPGLPHVRATVALAGFELADALQQDGAAGEAAAARRSASTELAAARALDPTFCLTHAVAARAAAGWQEAAGAAVRALQALSTCGEPFAATARDVGRDALREAAHAAQVEERMAQLVAFIESSATATATPDLHLALSHAHLEVGATRAAIAAAERALELTRPDDPATRAQRAEARALLHELQRSAGAT